MASRFIGWRKHCVADENCVDVHHFDAYAHALQRVKANVPE
jgi:hypothetical protein